MFREIQHLYSIEVILEDAEMYIKQTMIFSEICIVKLRQGSGKDWQGMAVKVKGLKA